MIDHVQALSLRDAERWFDGSHESRAAVESLCGGRVAWVGALDGEMLSASPVRLHAGPKLLLAFVDVDPSGSGPAAAGPHGMRPAQAARVVALVRSLHAAPEPWALMVHCYAGVSRSAAIAEWAQRAHSRMPAERFLALHPHVAPNPHVLRLLRAADPGA